MGWLDIITGPLAYVIGALIAVAGVFFAGKTSQKNKGDKERAENRLKQVLDENQKQKDVTDAIDKSKAGRDGDDDWHKRLSDRRAGDKKQRGDL